MYIKHRHLIFLETNSPNSTFMSSQQLWYLSWYFFKSKCLSPCKMSVRRQTSQPPHFPIPAAESRRAVTDYVRVCGVWRSFVSCSDSRAWPWFPLPRGTGRRDYRSQRVAGGRHPAQKRASCFSHQHWSCTHPKGELGPNTASSYATVLNQDAVAVYRFHSLHL